MFNKHAAGQASIWLIFLWMQMFYAVVGGMPWGLLALGVVAIVAFSYAYVMAFGRFAGLPMWMWLLAMAIPTALGVFVFHQWALSFLPYFAAYLAFHLPAVRSAVLIACMSVAGFVAAFVVDPAGKWAYLSIVTLGPVLVWVMAQMVAAEDAKAAARKQTDIFAERERIARDVHDVLGHSLTVINLKSELAARLVETDPEAARREIAEITSMSRTALAEARSTVTRMRNPHFSGEIEASRRAFETAGIAAILPSEGLAGSNAQLFSWVLREATTNILRHADCSRVVVQCTPMKLQIDDDGVGLDGASLSGGGLEGLRGRVNSAGGQLSIGESALGGTRVLLSMTQDMEALDIAGSAYTDEEER